MCADPSNRLHIRPVRVAEAEEVIELVLRSFDEFVAPDYALEGVQKFHTDVTVASLVEALESGDIVLLGIGGSNIAGVVKVRDETHISWLFVAREFMTQGIGRRLLSAAVQEIMARTPAATAVTLNASPYALPIYAKMGFAVAGAETVEHGMRMTPMQASIEGLQ